MGAKITKLNLSGHGVGGGSGLQFSIHPFFDFSNLSPLIKKRFVTALENNATVKLWTCDSAATKQQCDNLQKASNDLSLTIVAKNSAVGSGPDIGTRFDDFASHIVAFFTKTDANRWIRFTPRSDLSNVKLKDGPEARLLEVQRVK